MNISLFYSFPIWLTGLGSFIVLIVAIELGYRIGLKSQDKWKDAEIGGGGIVQTSLLALLGLVLAFTYASVVSRHDARKSTVHVEANTLGTSFLRAGLVAEPGRTELKEALLGYARTRVMSHDKLKTIESRKAVVSASIAMQDKIWPAMMRAFSEQEPAPLKASIISSVNDVLDAHTLRLAAAFDRLPRVVIWMLLIISAASLSVVGSLSQQGCR